MRLSSRIPRVIASTVEKGPPGYGPIFDGRDVVVPNVWNLPAHTVALAGRPAVWYSLDVATPEIRLGPMAFRPVRIRIEQDFGGHLYLIVIDGDARQAHLIEAGPSHSNGTGALVPYLYPEGDLARHGEIDFDPVPVAPPNGLPREYFAELVRSAQRAYDGDQRYLAVELPFLRVGRDSNSYAFGVLLACGVDPRAIPKPAKMFHWEWTGYPGAEDPVHRANFGAYLGAPSDLGDGLVAAAYHDEGGGVRFVAVGGAAPGGQVRLPDGSAATLDAQGRCVLAPDAARRCGLPVVHTEPPEQIRRRRRFPPDPSPAGAQITLVVDGASKPLRPGDQYTGTIVERNDALGLATLEVGDRKVVLPLLELGVELRDPARVDRLLRVGNGLTVGLLSDRRPKLVAHGDSAPEDAAYPKRAHLELSRRGAIGMADVLGGFISGAVGGLAAVALKIICERIAPPRHPGRLPPPAVVASDWRLGVLASAAYGALVEVDPALRAGSGVAFGLALWVHEVALPMLAPTGPLRLGEAANEAATHALWGFVVERLREAVRRCL